MRWIHDYLNVKCEEDSPSEKVKFIDRFFISEFYDTVYTKEAFSPVLHVSYEGEKRTVETNQRPRHVPKVSEVVRDCR